MTNVEHKNGRLPESLSILGRLKNQFYSQSNSVIRHSSWVEKNSLPAVDSLFISCQETKASLSHKFREMEATLLIQNRQFRISRKAMQWSANLELQPLTIRRLSIWWHKSKTHSPEHVTQTTR